MAKYMLLLYNDISKPPQMPSAEEMQKMTEKYMAWRNKPFTLDGARLGNDFGKVIRTKGDKISTTDGPFSETKEVLGGYYTIEASSYDEAMKLTQGHPHLEYGGSIEIRHVFGT